MTILKLWFALRLLGIIKMFMKEYLIFQGIGPSKSTDSLDFRADSRNSKNKVDRDEDSVFPSSALV